MLDVKLLGVQEAEALIRRLEGGARAAGEMVVRVGSPLNYAWGIEFGRKRSGALARRAGGSFALTGAFARVQPQIGPTLAKALPLGPAATLRTLKALGLRVLSGMLDLLTSTVYATPIPRYSFRRTKVLKRRSRSMRAPNPMWRRTGNLRRSYHMETEGG